MEQKEINEETEEGLTDWSLLSMEDIWDFSQTVDIEDESNYSSTDCL